MKCYIHPERDAVGVCVMCGHGVCEACSIVLNGKTYCKQCMEKIVTKSTGEAAPRAASITIASIFLYIFGALGIIGSLFALAIGGAIGSISSSIAGFGIMSSKETLTTLMIVNAIIIFLGLLLLILSILEVVAGYWLWHSLKKGGILGLIICTLDILMSIPFFFSPFFAQAAAIRAALNVLVITLIAIGWNTLK